ncbi:MAG: hypothetical protein RIS70_1281 [Planctomycetota bacterium]
MTRMVSILRAISLRMALVAMTLLPMTLPGMALTGCQGANSRSSIFSPGTTKVPAPATGSVGKPDQSYYNKGSGASGSPGLSQLPGPPGTPSPGNAAPGISAVGTGVRDGNIAAAPSSAAPGPQMGSNPWAGGVQAAGFSSESTGNSSFSPGSTNLKSRLRGMPATDATQPASRTAGNVSPNGGASERSGAIEITDLPPPGSSSPPRRLSMSSGPATAQLNDDEPDAGEYDASDAGTSTAHSGSTPLNWKSPR